jgi:hypothetical protein
VDALAGVARTRSEHLFPNAVPRLERRGLLQLSGQRRRRIRETCGGVGHGHLPHFRFAELSAEFESGDGSGAGNARHLRRRDLLHRRHPRPEAHEVFAEVLLKLAKELEQMGAHMLAIKDMAGLCKPAAARRWSRR